jgi:hypothetical protein
MRGGVGNLSVEGERLPPEEQRMELLHYFTCPSWEFRSCAKNTVLFGVGVVCRRGRVLLESLLGPVGKRIKM